MDEQRGGQESQANTQDFLSPRALPFPPQPRHCQWEKQPPGVRGGLLTATGEHSSSSLSIRFPQDLGNNVKLLQLSLISE